MSFCSTSVVLRRTLLQCVQSSKRCKFPAPVYLSRCKYSSRARQTTMEAWQVNRYGGVEALELNAHAKMPAITWPNELLVEVHAASVNPIDTKMIEGYGSGTLNPLRKLTGLVGQDSQTFPLIPGRDFSGTVIATGRGVPSRLYKPGDEVWGAVNAVKQGTHAKYLSVCITDISKKPTALSHIEAASIPYVATTTWSALCTTGALNERNTSGKRVLIYGGSGGIGTFAIQLLKAWGADVTVTCSTDAINMVLSLGADVAIDYKTYDIPAELRKLDKFDFIYDCVGQGTEKYSMEFLKSKSSSKYVSIVVPFLKNSDELGLPLGLAKSAFTLGSQALMHLQEDKHYRWAVFLPNGKALGKIARLMDEGKIIPRVTNVYNFEAVPDAYRRVISGCSRGKTVIDVQSTENEESEHNEERMR